MAESLRDLERRVLVLAPVGKDAPLIESMLRRHAVECLACSSLELFIAEMNRGVAAILIAEEALMEAQDRFANFIAGQPPWSDLPVLVLTQRGADSPVTAHALESLGNVTLLERPVRVQALASAVRSALRARERQYQTRAHLEEREEADRRKDQFLATLAHELRNPLAPIRNGLYVLQRSEGVDRIAASVSAMMERQVDHLVRLVDDLMEVSRITRGKIVLRREVTDLASIVGCAVETSRPAIDAAGHALEVALPPEPLLLDADPVRLAQVFANLLHNATKYTDSGGRISIGARREGEETLVTVHDTGIGIPAQALTRIFEMFVQADASDSRAHTGLGIGLTLARSLVELHGGTISAASDGPGCGSLFTVRLPLLRKRQANAPVPARITPELEGSPRILVVDDNADAADSLGALLRMLGADVRIAYNGSEALETFAAFRPALAFLDLGMPHMDGYQVAQRIRECFPGAGPMLVALTGRGQEKDRRLSAAAGFDRHLIKPADIAALRTLIAAAANPPRPEEKAAAGR